MMCLGEFNAVGTNEKAATEDWTDTKFNNRLLLLKLATKFRHFPLLGIQTFAALYHQTRTEDLNNKPDKKVSLLSVNYLQQNRAFEGHILYCYAILNSWSEKEEMSNVFLYE